MSTRDEIDEQPSNAPQNTGIGRRGFIQTSSFGLLAAALLQPEIAAEALAQPSVLQNRTNGNRPYFRTETYSNRDLEKLYGKEVGIQAIGPEKGRPQSQHMMFHYDNPADRLLLNPLNVKPSLAAAKHSMDITILNSHVSNGDFNDLWKNFKHDAQLHLGLTAPSSDISGADDLTWTLLNGIDIFLGGGGFKGIDKRLKPFLENNKPTSKLRPSETIEVPTGTGNLQLQVSAQRKESWWRKLLTIGGAALSSPLFATLPIPRLLPEGLQFATTVLNHIRETEPLVPIWTSARIPFKLYEGATPSSPFTLRPGLWLTVDRDYAEQNLDENKNLKNHLLDVAGQFYELKTANGQPADANYLVVQFDFRQIKEKPPCP